jgi:predicted NUDIX family NTP pyrophosphohydrolase
MKKQSAGILLFQKSKNGLNLFLVHPGGPFWKNKDAGAWSVPKGEFSDDEDPLTAAIREFREETGMQIDGNFIPLTALKQKSGKIIYAWAAEGDIDASKIVSNECEIEWPPKSGKKISIPEVDKGEWFTIEQAYFKIIPGQKGFIKELENIISPQ